MANANLLNTNTAKFSGLFSNGYIYKVPTYQRDYSWKKDNWEDLWLDILDVHNTQDSQKNSHYMGALVLKRAQDDEVRTIIDGQQRIATLSILVIAVIKKIDELVDREIDPEGNQERRDILRRSYLGDKHPGSLRYSSKLFLNANNDNFYQGNLINLREPRSIRKLRSSNQLLWKAFTYFSDQLSELDELVNDGLLLSNFITETIAKKLLFIEIVVDDDINAYTVFETLNSRGVELSATDLLKNYIFSQFESEDDLIAAQREWQEITRTIGMNKFPEFLKYFLSMTRPRVRNKDLFKLTKKEVNDAAQAFDLLEQLNELSELYVALGNPNDSFWLDFDNASTVRNYIDELNLFRTKQSYPALFSAYKRFDQKRFEKLLKVVTVISFRYISVSGLNPNDLEKQYNSLANQISADKVKSPKSAFKVISSLYVKDEKFRQDFASLTLTDRRKKLLQYIIKSLEKDRSGRDSRVDSFSIEHILPQNPDESWFQSFRDDEIDEAIYRLGNITLLEQSRNSRLGSKPYEEKKKAYQQSSYEMTKDIVADEWTMSEIVKRQEMMADRAVHIWRIDYS